VFAGIEQMGGKMIRTLGQARAHFAMTMMAAGYNMRRLAFFNRVEIVPFTSARMLPDRRFIR